jgi:hypothetical protein
MTLANDVETPGKRFPRALAYPFLLVVLIGGIFGGIRLGSSELGSTVALASQNDTPIENWTLFFIGIGIVMFLYLERSYAQRNFAVSLTSLLVALAALLALLLFGAWGLGGFTVACILVYVGYYLNWRLPNRRSQANGKQ